MDNKKVFSIKINGITENVDAVKSLNEQLRECEGIIRNLQNAEIKVKVSGGDKVTQKVSGGKSSSDDKVALEIEKEKTKQIEMQTDALRQQYVEREQLKQQNKEALEDIKQEAKGYVDIVDGVKEYSNTLNGMSAELKDIKRELRNTDVDSEAFEILTQKAADLNEKLKSAEEAYGQFGRNVGNYTQSIIDALDEWDENKEFRMDFNVSGAEGSLKDLKNQLSELKQYWQYLSPDDANFDKTAQAIKSLNNQITDMESKLKDVGAEANSAFTGRFTTTIGGVEASFSNASEACEALRKKLVAMRVAGEENTPMYQEIIQLVRRLQKEVQTANKEIEGMSKMSSNLNKVVGVMKGFSGVAALGQGIAGLFGEGSEEIEKFVQRFASLSLVLSGLSALEEELNKGTSAFARFTNSTNEIINKLPLIKQVGDALNGIIAVRDMQSAEKTIDGITDSVNRLLPNFQQISSDVYNAIQASSELNDSFNKLSKQDRFKFFNAGSIDELRGVSSELDDFADKMKEVMDADESFKNKVEELFRTQKKAVELNKQHTQATEQLGEAQNTVTSTTGKFANALTSLAQKSSFASKALYGVATAIQVVMKATIVLALIQALMWAVEKLTDGLKGLGRWISSFTGIQWLAEKFDALKTSIQNFFGILSGSQLDKLNRDMKNLQNTLNAMNTKIDIDIQIGNMGEVEGQLEKVNAQLETLNEMQNRLMGDSNIKEWAKELSNIDTDKVNKLSDEYKDTISYLQKVTSLSDDYWKSLEGLSTADQFDKLQKDLGLTEVQLQNALSLLNGDESNLEKFIDKLEDIDSDLNDIGTDGFNNFGLLGSSIDNARKIATQAAARIKKDLDALQMQEWQLKLTLNADDIDTRLKIVKHDMDELAKTYGMIFDGNGNVSKKNGKALTEEEQRIAKHLQEINRMQKESAENANEEAKKSKEEEAERDDEDAKRKEKEATTRARNEANARLEAMEEGKDKEIALLEQKRKEEIEDAKETGKRVEDINTIYDRKVLDVKKKYEKYLRDAQREHNKKMLDIAKEFATEWMEIQREIEDSQADTSLGKVENNNMTVKQSISYDTNTQGTSEGINAQKEYYKQMRDAQVEYINEREQLDIEAAEREHQRMIEDENARFNTEKEAYELEIEEQKRALKEKVDNAQISQEEMDSIIAELQDAYHKGEQDRLEQHNEKIAEITKHGEEVVTTIQLEAQEERQKNNMDALNNQLDAIQTFYNDIDKVMERTQKRNTNQFGFIDYSTYRKSLKDALDATKETSKQIDEQKKQLQADLDAKKISFDDFQKAKKELDDFSEEVNDKTKEMQEALNGSFNSWMSGLMDNINQYGSVLSGMFSTISEMYNRSLDAQQEKLDKEQELLDKELEMIEENLQKQEEVTEQHKDKVNTIEDELKSARGDRRQALIDQLAAERKSQEESMKKEKQLTEEKKKQAQKQEQLKKQQDALDKKRKQQEKRAAIVQATINTFTAVSNALAVQPFYVGLALSAVALGLGIANVAQISSQQYADGGLLNGKRHSQGGMKIQGTNMEVEGGEYVTNRVSTNANLPLLEYINSNRRTLTKDDLIRFYDNGKTTLINRQMQSKFEDGGQLPQLSVDVKSLMNNAQSQGEQQTPVVSVVDIINAMDNVQQVRVLAGDIDND